MTYGMSEGASDTRHVTYACGYSVYRARKRNAFSRAMECFLAWDGVYRAHNSLRKVFIVLQRFQLHEPNSCKQVIFSTSSQVASLVEALLEPKL